MMQVTKIIFDSINTTSLRATGVAFSVNSTVSTAQASKEVIISAGTVKTPQVLELSGTVVCSYSG